MGQETTPTADLITACRELIVQYEADDNYTMGGKLTNKPFFAIRDALKAIDEAPASISRPGGLFDLAAMDCPVFLLQEKEEGDTWRTVEGAWFTADEATAFAKAISHRVGEHRAYGIGARGQLKTLLKAHTEEADNDVREEPAILKKCETCARTAFVESCEDCEADYEGRKSRMDDVVAALRADGMQCNCDLDNWQPEPFTGHSHVCRIHKAATRIANAPGCSEL